MDLILNLKVENELGLHGRAAAKIVELASAHGSDLYFKKEDVEVDGSSILSILTLACPIGSSLEARIAGEDAEEMSVKLTELFKDKFGEGK